MQTEKKLHHELDEEVRIAAYFLWLERTERGLPGDADGDWYHGEAEIEHRHRHPRDDGGAEENVPTETGSAGKGEGDPAD